MRVPFFRCRAKAEPPLPKRVRGTNLPEWMCLPPLGDREARAVVTSRVR
ncbi:hypothetical protein [Micromonospora sp. KC213]|nr:hypothetical protein [Micromonospora sp. KC213]